jgi:hypothetical protein
MGIMHRSQLGCRSAFSPGCASAAACSAVYYRLQSRPILILRPRDADTLNLEIWGAGGLKKGFKHILFDF